MIRINNLTKRFGDFTAVDGVSLDVGSGEAVALLGPNGSGKTTTLNCLTGLTRPDRGNVTIGGIDVALQPKAARTLLSFLPQRVAFHECLTALEVLELYCRLRKLPAARASALLETVGLDAMKSAPVGEFSSGMVQRLGVAVALLPDAPVLVLDEPAASLDPEGAAHLRKVIRELKTRGRTILFSTHVLADADLLADRAAILAGGRLVAVERLEALRDLQAGLRVMLHRMDEKFANAVLGAGASDVVADGETLTISCRPDQRLTILRAVEAAGGVIERFSTIEPSLEEIYLRCVNAKGAGPDPADLERLREAVSQAG